MGSLSINNAINPAYTNFNGFGAWESLNNAVEDGVTFRPAVGINGVLNGITSAYVRSAVSTAQIVGPATFTNSYEPTRPMPLDLNMAYGLNGEAVVTIPVTNYTRMAHCILYSASTAYTVSILELGVSKGAAISVTGSGYWPATRIVDTGAAIEYWRYDDPTSTWILWYTSLTYAPPVAGWRADVCLRNANTAGTVLWRSGV
jgi:hypothetical protein